MPEYLTPAVYVEETSYRSKSIEGVATSTFGMAGRTEYGPVPYHADNTPVIVGPTLVSSLTEYERAFGGLRVGDDPCWLALSARAFFANGGRRLYVSRVFPFGEEPKIDRPKYFASLPVPAQAQASLVRWWARWPGAFGGRIKVTVGFRRSRSVLFGGVLKGVAPGAAVELAAAGAAVPKDGELPKAQNLKIVARAADGRFGYRGADGAVEPPADDGQAFHITLTVTVAVGSDRADVYSGLEVDSEHPRSITNVLQLQDPPDEFALVWLELPDPRPDPGQLLSDLLEATDGAFLTGGGSGDPLSPEDLIGDVADPDDVGRPATGLEALGEIDDIAIVAMPDTAAFTAEQQRKAAVDGLIDHCERQRYRMAVVDPAADSSISEVRAFRSQFDTKYAA
ncbi:MAG: hypothetical protein WCG47_29190, partial [Dermatophilaceae bacterium]